MNRTSPLISTVTLLLVGLYAGSGATDRTAVGPRTALDRYIQAPDTNYSFRVASTVKGDGCTTYMIDMRSQAWLTTNEVNRPVWQHWLTLVKPDEVTSSTALLMIGGGSHRTNPPSGPDVGILTIATSTKASSRVLTPSCTLSWTKSVVS